MSAESTDKHNVPTQEHGRNRCVIFDRRQRCPFQDRCYYAHVIEDPISKTNFTHQPSELTRAQENIRSLRGNNEGSITTGDLKGLSPKICRFFVAGQCGAGPSCSFIHPGQSWPQRRRNFGPCKFFNSPSGCKFGKQCKYAHVKKDDIGKSRRETSRRPHQDKNASERPVCRHFIMEGCMLREKCRFRHPQPDNEIQDLQVAEQVKGDEGAVETKPVHQAKIWRQRVEKPVCHHFIRGGCMLREKCPYRHPEPDDGIQDLVEQVKQEEGAVETKPAPKKRFVAKRPQSEFSLKSLIDEEIEDLRQGEIAYLQKRYTKTESVPHPKPDEESYKIRFVPTDPDWPYDVKAVDLMLYFPKEYPKKAMEVSLLQDDSIPESVRRSIAFTIEDWLEERFSRLEMKGRIELVLRAFLRWLDRNLEEIFTDALKQYKRELVAKAAGIQFIPARHLQAQYKERDAGTESSEDEDEQVEETRAPDAGDIKPWGEMKDEKKIPSAPTGLDSARKGTELAVKGLQLYDSVGTLNPLKIKIVIRCQRCKTNEDVTTPPDRVNSVTCRHCHSEQLVKFRHSLLHSFSSLLGYLDLNGCAVVDVILFDCDFKASCMRCDREQCIGGLPPGQVKEVWCESCHAKMSVRVDSNQFTVLKPAEIQVKSGKGVHQVETTKVIKTVRDPAIQEGKPLPNQGTCKHYAKSYRWLRFPCCGKAYPCDICHDNAEGDHEMKYANRMICGFCGKEQPYSVDRPCVACGNNVTRKASEHWEGGKGCRDKIKMSRNDDKKYANNKKTVSRHAQLNAQPGKKVTKLRHA